MTPAQIKKELKDRGLNQKELADLLGVTPVAVYLWTSGERTMSRQSKMLIKLSNKKLREIKVL